MSATIAPARHATIRATTSGVTTDEREAGRAETIGSNRPVGGGPIFRNISIRLASVI